MTATVLLYNLSGTEAGKKLKNILLKMRVRIRLVEPESYLEPIGHLAGLKDAKVSGQKYEGPGFSEQMMVMCGFTGELLDILLFQMRKQGVGKIPLKAVLTDFNQHLNSLMLYEELKKEHEAMTERRRQEE